MHKKKSCVSRILIAAVLLVLALTYLYPLFFMGVNSIKSQGQYMESPFSVMLNGARYENYTQIFYNFKLGRYLLNTLWVTVLKLLITVPLALFASYAFAKLRFSGKNAVYPAVISVMFIPFQVIMIPLYVMLTKVHLVNTYTGYIVVAVTLGLPAMIMLLTSFMHSVPNEMLEAAKIDGCGYFRTVFNIVAPMSRPVLSINLIISFISSWNDVLMPMVIIKDTTKQLVMPALNNLVGQFSKDIPMQLAGILVATIPAILIYVFLQKQIIMGITDGSAK